MATMLNGTMGAAKSLLESAMQGASQATETAVERAKDVVDSAKDVVDSAKDGTQHVASSARSKLVDGVRVLTGAVTVLRSLGVGDALGWVGLERRPHPLISAGKVAGLFGAGFAAGAGAGVLFAPMSGAALRGRIVKAFTGPEAKATLHRIETEVQANVKSATDTAGEIAAKAKDAAMKTERTVERSIAAGAETVKNKVEAATGAAKDTAKHAVDDAMAALGASDTNRASGAYSTQGTQGTQGMRDEQSAQGTQTQSAYVNYGTPATSGPAHVAPPMQGAQANNTNDAKPQGTGPQHR